MQTSEHARTITGSGALGAMQTSTTSGSGAYGGAQAGGQETRTAGGSGAYVGGQDARGAVGSGMQGSGSEMTRAATTGGDVHGSAHTRAATTTSDVRVHTTGLEGVSAQAGMGSGARRFLHSSTMPAGGAGGQRVVVDRMQPIGDAFEVRALCCVL